MLSEVSANTDEQQINLGLQEVLDEFIIDNPDFESLEAIIDQFNIFDAIGVVRHELRHSDFLAFLLNPHQNHGLGDIFLKTFLQKVLVANKNANSPVNLIDLDVWNLGETTVLREWHNIDILLLNEKNKLVVVIENKITSEEHSDQLKKYYKDVSEHYPSWKKIPIFLTPDGYTPSDDRYLPMSYGMIANLIDSITKRYASTIGPDVNTLLYHYMQMLRRHIVSESEIAELCRRIYNKHQRALDLIYEHRPDVQSQMKEALEKMIESFPNLIADHCSKSNLKFTTKSLDEVIPKDGTGWVSSGRILLFETFNEPNRLKIALTLGPGPANIRQRIFQLANLNRPPFILNFKTLYPIYNRLWSNTILTAHDYQNSDSSDLIIKMQKKLTDIITITLPAIENLIIQEMKKVD